MAPLDAHEDSGRVGLGLSVKACDGKSFRVRCESAALTVLDLKNLCAGHCGVAAAHQRLFFKGSELKDDQRLQETRLRENSTLFLTKAPSWKKEVDAAPEGKVPCAGGCGAHGSSRTDNFCPSCFAKQRQGDRDRMWSGILAEPPVDGPTDDKAVCAESDPDQHLLVVGAPVRLRGLQGAKGLNGRLGWIVKYLDDSARYSVKLKGEEGTKAVKAGNLRRLDNVAPLSASKVLVQKDTSRCWCCRRKCGLTGFQCRCGYTFCSKHRHAEDHACDFDHQRMGQELISKSNPKLQTKWDVLAGL